MNAEIPGASIYKIKHIVFASGRDRRFLGIGYLASDVAQGCPDTFWPIHFRTIQSHRVVGHPDLVEVSSDIESDLEGRPGSHKSPSCPVEIIYNSFAEAAFLDALDKWCIGNPDKFFALSCPGHRPGSINAASFHIEETPIFVKATFGQCLQGAIANGIHALDGPDQTLLMLRLGPHSASSLLQAGAWIEHKVGRYGLQKVKLDGNLDEEEWLTRKRKGIFLARLHGIDAKSEEVDHVIAINSSRMQVYDCIERFAMPFERTALNVCVGDVVHLLGISELRQVVLQKVRRKKNKSCRKITLEVQQERKKQRNNHQKDFTSSKKTTRSRRGVVDEEMNDSITK